MTAPSPPDPSQQYRAQAEDQAKAAAATSDEVPDDIEVTPVAPAANAWKAESDFEALTDAEIAKKLAQDPASLGPLSIGRPSAGRLLNGVPMPEGDRWEIIDRHNAYGTQETVDFLIAAIDSVHAEFPDSPKLYLGHIGARNGGPLSPHLSHQSGRDVDISYFYTSDGQWYSRATAQNLDVARTWSFVRALIASTDVEMILIDYSIQKLLREHAETLSEDRAWLDEVFQYQGKGKWPLIRHVKGHATHIHIRFFSPKAQAGAQRAYRQLVDRGLVKPAVSFIQHKAKSGDTLGSLANRYKTTIAEIKRLNGLAADKIFAKRVYKVPKKGGGVDQPAEREVWIPPRKIPPPRVKPATL